MRSLLSSKTTDSDLNCAALPQLPSPQLLSLQEANLILCQGFERAYGINITPPNVRLLTEPELDGYVRNGGPSWKRNKVNLCAGQDIGLNPHIGKNDQLQILPHEIGHAVLDAAGFDVEPYLPRGLMGPRRVLHEMVADTFEADGALILRENRLVGNFISRWFDGLFSPWSPLMSFMKEKNMTMKDLLASPEAVLSRHSDFFSPRENWG